MGGAAVRGDGEAVAPDALVVRGATAGEMPTLAALRSCAEGIGTSHAFFGEPIGHLETSTWPDGGTTLVVELAGEVVAAGRYLRIGSSTEATIALAVGPVEDERAVAGVLVEALACAAHAEGVEHFIADLLTTNASMLAVFVRSGFPTEIGVGDGLMHMSFRVDPSGRDAGRSKVRAVPIWQSVVGSTLAEMVSSAPSRAAIH